MKSHRILTCCFTAVICSVLAGCASITTGTHKKVTFKSVPEGATVTVLNRKGKIVAEGTTPFSARLIKGRPYFAGQRYTVTFVKDGFFDSKLDLKSTLNGWYMGNLVFGGLVGLIVVDPLTGAMYTLPKEVSTNLNLKTTTQAEEPDLRVVHLQDVPATLRDQLVRLQ